MQSIIRSVFQCQLSCIIIQIIITSIIILLTNISYSLHTNTLYTGKTASVGITCFLRSRPTFLLARTIFGVPRKLKTRISSSNNCKMFRATPIAKQPCFCVPIIAKDQTKSYEAHFVSLLNHIGIQSMCETTTSMPIQYVNPNHLL